MLFYEQIKGSLVIAAKCKIVWQNSYPVTAFIAVIHHV